MELHELLEEVKDEKTFLEFARALHNERREDIELEKHSPSNPYSPTQKGWENITLEDFLEGSIAWADSTDFGKKQDIKDNPWYKFAVFLLCGKTYE